MKYVILIPLMTIVLIGWIILGGIVGLTLGRLPLLLLGSILLVGWCVWMKTHGPDYTTLSALPLIFFNAGWIGCWAAPALVQMNWWGTWHN